MAKKCPNVRQGKNRFCELFEKYFFLSDKCDKKKPLVYKDTKPIHQLQHITDAPQILTPHRLQKTKWFYVKF